MSNRRYLKNSRGSKLPLVYSSNTYQIPSPGIYVDEWDVPENLREELVQHALGYYGSVREPTPARGKQKPAQAILRLETHNEEGEVVA